MSDLALSVRGLSKSYTIAHQRAQQESTLAETVLQRLKRPFVRSTKETFWALRDVSFDVKKGEVVGIIGRNGAGKSTLLKVLSRITEPTEGQIDLFGRVGSLLEVGTGFHPELTGRENVFLNGAILGMTRAEIRKQFDAIVDFAGVEKFLDTPVKRYSSGMYVRLAFAVAAHLRSEILIVDEVLAVGDAEFQKKCLGKMQDVAHDGRTVLFVSHNMAAVRSLCSTAIVLSKGAMQYAGRVTTALEAYASEKMHPKASDVRRGRAIQEAGFSSAALVNLASVAPGEEIIVKFEWRKAHSSSLRAYVSAHVLDEWGMILAQCDSRFSGFWIGEDANGCGILRFRSPWLKPGRYTIDLFLCSSGMLDAVERAIEFTVSERLPYAVAAVSSDALASALVLADFDYRQEA